MLVMVAEPRLVPAIEAKPIVPSNPKLEPLFLEAEHRLKPALYGLD
jgi:hypothetical protein